MLMLIGVVSRPDCDAVDLVGCRSPRSWTSAIITVRPPRVMLAVPVMAARRETLLPESWSEIRDGAWYRDLLLFRQRRIPVNVCRENGDDVMRHEHIGVDLRTAGAMKDPEDI